MPARKRKNHTTEEKNKIRASQLLNRLYTNAMAEEEFMSAGQIASANSVVDRYIPKRKAVEHEGEVGVTILRKTVYEDKP